VPRNRREKSALLRLLVLPAGFYLVAFAILTFPLLGRFSSHFFLDSGDGLQNVWNVWWVNEAVTRLGVNPWYTSYLHHPEGVTLLGHTLNAFNGFLGIALLPWLSLTQTVNTIVVFAFVTGGLTAFWLTWRLTGGSFGGSLLSGFVFTFSSYHFSHAEGHLQLVSLEWIPLFLLSWFALLERPRLLLAVGSSLALFLVLLCDYYYFFYCVLTGAIVFLWSWRRAPGGAGRFLRERWASLGAFVGTTLLTSGWILFPLLALSVRDPMSGSHPARVYSMDLLAPFVYGGHWRFASLTEPYWSRITGNIHESSVHLGLSVVLILVLLWRRRGEASHPSLRLWYGILLFFGVMSLGPSLWVGGVEILVNVLPYRLLELLLPPLRLSGVPVRMMVMVFLSAGVLCGMAFQLYASRERKSHLPAIALLGLLFVEYLPGPIPTTRVMVPPYVGALAGLPGEGAVVIADEVSLTSLALYYQTVHRRPMAFGYVSRFPESVLERDRRLAAALGRRDLRAVRREHGVRYVVIPVASDARRRPSSDPPVVFEDAAMRIYDLGPGG